MIRDLRELFSWLGPRDRRRWYLLVPLSTAAALAEAVGALAVFGLFRLVVEPDRVSTTPVVMEIARQFPGADPQTIIAGLTLAIALFYLGRGLLLATSDWLRERAVQQSGAYVAERLVARYLHADYLYHVRRQSASMIEEASRSTELAFQLVASSSVNLFAEGLITAALITVLVLNAPGVTLSTVAMVVAAAGAAVFATRRLWTRLRDEEKRLAIMQLHVLQQSLAGIKDVIITGRQAFFESRFHDVRRALARLKEQRLWLASFTRIGVETGLMLCMLLVLLVVMLRGSVGADTVSVLALFGYTGFRLVPSANRMILNAGWLREGGPFVRSVSRELAGRAAAPAAAVPEPVLTFADRILVDDLTLAYEPGAPPSLTGVSVEIRRGESIGIVGPTGAGKSTLVDVLLGLLSPTSGRVLIDGVPLPGLERAWQRLIGYVPQDVYLLDDTLRRNIAFGVADALIDDARLARAVSLARLDDVIAGLPAKLETIVGEDGVRLSGGQRQRVAIARALYHDPPVLVFDEATAALDSQTEREVTAAIAALHGSRTLIAIAHRLSTVRECDRLIYLRDGRVAGIGKYDELIRDPGFRSLT